MVNRKLSLIVEPGFCILLALCIVTLPFRWLAAWFISSLVHEVGHVIALCLLGSKIYNIRITSVGAIMNTGPLSCPEECISAAAGPLTAAILIFAGKWFPELAICSFVQTLYNMLPIYPLDGGRVMKSALSFFLPYKACKRVMWILHIATVCSVSLLFFYFMFLLKINPVTYILMYIVMQAFKIKIPCKRRKQIVQ